MSMKKNWLALALCAAVGSLTVSMPASANLITNGSFEANTIVPAAPGDPYQFIGEQTSTPLTGWTSHSSWRGIILYNAGYQPVADGVNAVQLEMPGDTLSQTFATVIGQAYELSYSHSAYDDINGDFWGTVEVTVAGAFQSVTAYGNNSFVAETLDFVASATSTTLMFRSVGDAFRNYPQLDNISVTAVTAPVPEPAALALLGLGLVGMAFSRRSGKA